MNHNLGHDELLALLRDATLKPESICEEIECAGATGCSAASIALARTLLETAATAGVEADAPLAKSHATAIATLPELLGAAVLRAAAEAGRQEVLREVATGASKPLAKEAKRELQRLKQKGVKVAALAPQGAAVMKAVPESEAPVCHVSSIDAYGERAVWYARSGRSGIDLAQVVISDIKGIVAADALGLSRKQHREFLKRLPRDGVVTVAEVPPAHARILVVEAEALGARNGFSPPASYDNALRVLGPAPEGPVPNPAADVDFGEGGELAHLLAGAALFDDPLFVAWIPEEDALREFVNKSEEIRKSELYIDEAQKQAAVDAAARAAAEAYFTEVRRLRYARRLLEMAHILRWEKRHDASRTSLAVSRALAVDAGGQEFKQALFSHAVALVPPRAGKPAAAQAAGLVVP